VLINKHFSTFLYFLLAHQQLQGGVLIDLSKNKMASQTTLNLPLLVWEGQLHPPYFFVCLLRAPLYTKDNHF